MTIRLNRIIWAAALAALMIVVAGGIIFRMGAKAQLRQIAVILPSDVNPFWIDVRRGAEQAAKELGDGFVVRITASNDQDAVSQISLLNNFLTRSAADVLVLGPASDSETVPTVAKYGQASIPIVIIDTELDPAALKASNTKIAAFIGSDNLDGGRKAGQTMAEALKGTSRRVLLIEGSPVHQSALDRSKGFREICDREGIEVIRQLGEWRRDKAREIVSATFIQQNFDGIFAANDDMALGAIAGLKGLRIDRDKWPIVIGFDATRDGLSAITNGDMYATIEQDAQGLGASGVTAAIKALSADPTLRPRELRPVTVRRR